MTATRRERPHADAREAPGFSRFSPRSLVPAALLAAAVAIGCTAPAPPDDIGSPTATPAAVATASPTVAAGTARPSPAATETASPTPTATPEPPLSLDLPETTDPRQVAVSITPEVPPDGDGRITVAVTNQSDQRIDELVLRWPSALADTLFLAPFVPSPDRMAPGQPLVQRWTKWVLGPGEHGEPDGTTSLGYGPIQPGETLDIPIYVTRLAAGPVAFDLQVLSRNDLLTLADGEPAELRVELP